jgi:excinuclease ABC subunit B
VRPGGDPRRRQGGLPALGDPLIQTIGRAARNIGDRVTVDVGVAEDAKPFLGSNFQATLRDLEAKMREAAGNLEFEEAARIRDEIKRLKLLDLEFANEALTPAGEAVDRGVVTKVKADARAEKAARWRKGGRR